VDPNIRMHQDAYQRLQFRKFKAVLVPDEVVHDGNLIVYIHCKPVALHEQPASVGAIRAEKQLLSLKHCHK